MVPMASVDRLLLGFLTAVAALAVIAVPDPWQLLFGAGTLAACIVAAARLRGRSPLWETVHAFMPVPVLGLLINLVGPVIARANPARWDALLARLDVRLLGPVVAAWMGAGGRPAWLTDAASIAYGLYYLMPVAAGIALWAAGRKTEFDRLVFSMTVVLLASYTGYFLAPASGPRIPDELAVTVLGGGRISAGLRAFLRTFERNELDAFPSGHTAASLVFLAEAWRSFPRLRSAAALAVGAIIFSTVYLSLHYALDTLAGAALAALVLLALPRLRVLCGIEAASPAASRPRPALERPTLT
jgi:membrane-associated phospholipid phosphatase